MDILLLLELFNTKKQEVKDALIQSGFEIEETLIMEDWVALLLRKSNKKDWCQQVAKMLFHEMISLIDNIDDNQR